MQPTPIPPREQIGNARFIEAAPEAITIIRELLELVKKQHEALKPIAHCVYNDNGDVTLDKGRMQTEDFLTARSALTLSTPLVELMKKVGM